MANGPALSTARRGEIYVGSEFRDSISLLDVLYANQFEGKSFNPKLLEQIEENFYRGAPPKWLNFYISEQAKESGGIIKRDEYDRLVEQICQKQKHPGISTVKLFHQPGCGGTTLAMQVLWDLRKSFRCAEVLTSSPSDITNVANEVINLYMAGSKDHQNTVLLLVNSEQILENLEDSIMKTIAEQEIVTSMPVVIFLSCIRKVSVVQNDNVALKDVLSDTEKQKFDEKKKELCLKYRDECERFHGFNIMQTNFSPDYVQQACKVFSTVKRGNRPRKTQLVASLSLLNDYVPGSYLKESQCLDFLKHEDDNYGDLSLEDRMEPFSHLITFQQDKRSGKKVSMAHHMIAQCCTELMAKAGVTRSDTAKNFLTCLCSDEVPPYLLGFVKDMLTKRGTKEEEKPISGTETDKDQEKFSRLILDIQEMEDNAKSASILKVASKKFDQNPFFPQALARFYCIELKDYNQAEMWAKRAKERDPQNSFVADTLGHVHKNHLKSKKCHPKERYSNSKELPAKPREIFQLAKKAIEAFKDEEQLAENQHGTDMKEDGNTKVSRVFNIRGLFGYLQVCNLVYDLLVSQDETWRRVLTKNVSIESVQHLLGDNKLNRFNGLIRSLRDEVERKCAFFDKYLTYSKPGMKKDDAPYISRDTLDCYKKYVGDSPPKNLKQKVDVFIQKLKQNLAETSAGVISCLDREHTESELKKITTWWEEIFQCNDSQTALANYIFSHIMLINKGGIFPFDSKFINTFVKKTPLTSNDTPELHLLNLLLCWPTDSEDKWVVDLSQLIQCMHDSYEHEYKAYFRSRYLRPLFFIGKGQGLDRIVHRKVLEGLFPKENKETKVDWGNDEIFQHSMVQERLIKVEGVVKNYRIYATVGGKEIEVEANLQNSLWRTRQVSFYLGFTIRGPVAFGIQTKTAEKELDSAKPGPIEPELFVSIDTNKYRPSEGLRFGACCRKKKSGDLTKLQPEVIKQDEVDIYSLHSEAGYYECSLSFLRWMCKEEVSLTYRFCSWEEYRERPSCKDYMPAGSLLDIAITAGKLEEMYLPHWIDYDSTMSDMFAALHVDSCGDFVEQVSEVTSSHIKLCQPTFTPWGAMIWMKLGFQVKVYYDILIYKTNKEFLTLHVYLVPPDGHIKKEVEEKETSYGSIIIPKPNPDESLQMNDHFFLTADTDTAKILPKKLQLTSGRKNYFEVFIRNAENDFCLELKRNDGGDDKDVVWTSIIRKGDYQKQSTDHEQASGQHFVDRHRTALINRVSDTGAILDRLMQKGLISQETYDNVRALTTPQNKMRDILRICTGRYAKGALLDILKGMKSTKALIRDLEESG